MQIYKILKIFSNNEAFGKRAFGKSLLQSSLLLLKAPQANKSSAKLVTSTSS